MNTRLDACALKRSLRLGSAGVMTLLALAACAVGSSGQRPDAAAQPGGVPSGGAPSGGVPPGPVTPGAEPPPSATATPSAETAAAAPEAPVAPVTPAPPVAPVPPQAGEAPPSGAPQSGVPPSGAPPSGVPSTGAPPSPAASANGAGAEKMLPPCVPVRRTRFKHHKSKQPPAPETPAPTGPPPPPPADAVVDAQVGEVGTSLSSILGKDVKSPKGEDLGRVVDVLADGGGHVRVAIIDFGGFLGVGTRRIAVDWPLLRFDPGSRDKPLVLSVDRKKLQSAPEYNSNRPRVLIPPAAPDAPDAGQTQK